MVTLIDCCGFFIIHFSIGHYILSYVLKDKYYYVSAFDSFVQVENGLNTPYFCTCAYNLSLWIVKHSPVCRTLKEIDSRVAGNIGWKFCKSGRQVMQGSGKIMINAGSKVIKCYRKHSFSTMTQSICLLKMFSLKLRRVFSDKLIRLYSKRIVGCSFWSCCPEQSVCQKLGS